MKNTLILKFGLSWKGRIIAHTLVTSLAAIFAILIFIPCQIPQLLFIV